MDTSYTGGLSLLFSILSSQGPRADLGAGRGRGKGPTSSTQNPGSRPTGMWPTLGAGTIRTRETNGCPERSGNLARSHSWALTHLNLTGGYISAGIVPDVRPAREVLGGSRRPSSELGRAWLGPPGSTGLVRLEEDDAGLPKLSEASGGSELRLEASERSGSGND